MVSSKDSERLCILSGSALKLIACLAMLSDHLAKFCFATAPWANTVWFSIAGRSISFLQLMLMFGRFAFPIFVFLLVEGFEKTHNRRKYGLSLLILGLISEIPFNLMNGTALDRDRKSVV